MSNSSTADAICEHIRDHACRYFPPLDGTVAKVRLVNEQQRVVSALYRFEVFNDTARYHVFAKGIPSSDRSGQQGISTIQRARLVPPVTEYGKRLWLECTALEAIHDHFEKLENPGFGTIRVLDFIEDSQTIIMEENRDPNLLSLFVKSSRLRHPFRKAVDLRRTFFNAGAWLKEYSTLPKTDNVTPRHTRREAYNESIVNFTDFLGRLAGNTDFFGHVAGTVTSAALQILPDDLPLALGHGDYAMRNILVGANDRITVIDTGAKWRVPIYEDIAYFLVRMEINKLQVFTQGLAIQGKTLASYQHEFLSGYFGHTAVPENIIGLFKIQSLLDNWSSRASSLAQQPGERKAIYPGLHLILLNRLYRKTLERLLQAIR